MNPALWGLIGLVILLLLSGFFASARSALSHVRRQTLRERAEKGDRQAAQVLTIAEDSLQVLSTFRFAMLIANFLLAGLTAVLLIPPLAMWVERVMPPLRSVSHAACFLVVMPLVALLAFLLTEVLPEALVHRDPLGWAMVLLAPARITIVLLRPLVSLTDRLQRGLAAPGGDTDSAAMVTEQEIMMLVDAGEEDGSIELEEKEMIYSILQLDETIAREIMVPRIDIVALEINTPLEKAREVVIEAGHSRIPVYEDTLDNIVGLLYAKDLLQVWHTGRQSLDMSALLRPALFVPESKRVSDLLRELQNTKVHMAIVIDEYGGTAGLVTLEDVVEEIFGEIRDEYDEDEEATYEAIGDGEYIFDARINLDDLNHLLATDLSDELGDTLGGFIYAQLGKIPEVGEVVKTEQVRIEVLSVVDRRIRKVHVRRLLPGELPDHPPEENGHAERNGDSR